MWAEPINTQPTKGTEGYKVKKEVDRRKKMAEQKGLDQLLSAVYHECIRNWPAWLLNTEKRKFVYPGTRGLISGRVVKDPKLGDIQITEFAIGDKRYRITSRRRGSFIKNDIFYILELFSNDEKVFAVSEYEEMKTSGTDYYPFSVDAYVNEDWVGDFIKIALHKEEMDKHAEAKPVEDLQMMEQLKKDFNIEGFPAEASVENKFVQKLSLRTWWVWLVVISIMLFLLYVQVQINR